MPHRAMVDMPSSRPVVSAAASVRASRDWQRPVSWRPFAAENPFASVLLAGALIAGLGMAGSGVARADETASKTVAQTTKPAAQLLPTVPLLLAQADIGGGPQVSLMQPAYADVLKGDASILVGIQPGRYTAASIELFVDDRSATDGPIPLTSSASTNFHWDTSKFLDGPHKLRVCVTDTQGFIGQTEVQVFVNNNKALNTAPPTLSWLNSPRGVLRGKVQLQLRAAGTFGVKFIMVSLNSAATPNIKPALATWFTNVPPYIISIDTTKYPDGLYVLSALGQNGLGEEGESQLLKIGISNNSINPTWRDQLPQGDLPDTTPVTPRGIETPKTQIPSLQKQPVAATSAQLTTVTKSREGAVEGTRRSTPDAQMPTTPARVSEGAAPRIAELDAGSRALTQRGTGAGATGTATNNSTTGSGSRLATNSGQTAKRTPTATGPAQLSVAPVAPQAAMQGSVVSGGQQGRLTADPRFSTPSGIARGASSNATKMAPTTQVAPFNPRTNITAPKVTLPPATNSTKPRVAMRPDPAPSHLQKREGATITVAPSQQSLTFPTSYRARKGETLQQVALRYGLPADILASVNEISVSQPLQDGQVLRLAQPLTVSYEGKPVVGDVSSMMMGTVAVTPFRFLFQKQGGTMTYDSIKHQVHAANSTQEVTLTIGSDTALVNQKDVAMDLAAFLLSGRTMIPVRFFEKALHAQVEWTPATGRVYVAMTP